jgi:hypothetical protein
MAKIWRGNDEETKHLLESHTDFLPAVKKQNMTEQ